MGDKEQPFVPWDGQKRPGAGAKREPLMPIVERFLDPTQQETKVLLIKGDAGSGKSLLARQITNMPLPDIEFGLFELRNFTGERLKRVIVDYYADKPAAGEAAKKQVVFVFDGYDEVMDNRLDRLWDTTEMRDLPKGAKIIVTSRPEHIEHVFLPSVFNSPSPDYNDPFFQEWSISPFQRKQVEAYLQQLPANNATKAMKFLEANPDVFELVSTPVLLHLFVMALPQLSGSKEVMRGDIYKAFAKAWFIEYAHVLPFEGRDLVAEYNGYAQRLAMQMYCDGKNWIKMLWSDMDGAWGEWLQAAMPDPKTADARRSCPLQSRPIHRADMDDQIWIFSFFHQTFYEFHVAESLWLALVMPDYDLTVKAWGAHCLMMPPRKPMIVSFLAEKLQKLQVAAAMSRAKRRRPTEEVGEEEEEEEEEEASDAVAMLKMLIQSSKREETRQTGRSELQFCASQYAASNAVTVLNKACIPLSVLAADKPDLFCNMQAPWADLSMAQLAGVDLTGAELLYCNLAGVKLNDAIVTNCLWFGASLKQGRTLEFPLPIAAVAASPDMKNRQVLVAVGKQVCRFVKGGNENRWFRVSSLEYHTGNVNCLAWAPDADGRRFASGGADKNVFVYKSGEVMQQLLPGVVNSVAWSVDGKQLAIGCKNKTLWLWTVDHKNDKAESEMKQLDSPDMESVTGVAWSPDGTWLASAGKDNVVRIWNAQTHQVDFILQGHHTDFITGVIWAPQKHAQNQRLAVCSRDNKVSVHRLVPGQPPELSYVLCGHTKSVQSAVWSPTGDLLVSCSLDKTICIWDTTTGQLVSTLRGHQDGVNSISWLADGNSHRGDCDLIFSASDDATVRLWQPNVCMPRQVGKAHIDGVNCVAASPDGTRIASGGLDNQIIVWDTASGIPQAFLKTTHPVRSVAWSPDGTQLASGGEDNHVRVWAEYETTGWEEAAVLQGHKNNVTSVAWSPTGQRLVSGSWDKTMRVWAYDPVQKRWKTAQTTAYIIKGITWAPDLKPEDMEQVDFVLEGHTDYVNSAACSPDGMLIASGSADWKTKVWNAFSGHLVNSLKRGSSDDQPEEQQKSHNALVACVAWSPAHHNPQLLATCSNDCRVRVWEADSENCRMDKELASDGITSVQWSPNGNELVFGSKDKAVRVLNFVTKEAVVLDGHLDWVTSVAWVGGDGDLIVSGSLDGSVRLWRRRKVGNNWQPLWSMPFTGISAVNRVKLPCDVFE